MLSTTACSNKSNSGGEAPPTATPTPPIENKSPVANAGEDQTVKKGTVAILDGSGSYDHEDNIIIYQWQLDDGTVLGEGITIEYDTSLYTIGTHTIGLLVEDSHGATGFDEMNITIVAPITPIPTPSFGPWPPDDDCPTPTPVDLTYNGVYYKTVVSPDTCEIWLDRNLGAARVCELFDDTACYGDYYQWGRKHDGHQDTPDSTSVQATNVNDVGHSDFIRSSTTYKYDWSYPLDTTGSTRSANWSKTDGSFVCPVGFRVPTFDEVEAERLSWTSNDNAGAFASPLKLPAAGYRNLAYANRMDAQGVIAYIWSSLADINADGWTLAFHLQATPTSAQTNVGGRSDGLPVRCIKD